MTWIRKSDDMIISDKEDEIYHNIAQEQFNLLSKYQKKSFIKQGEPGYSQVEIFCDTVIEDMEIRRRVYGFCMLEINNGLL